MDPRDEMIQDQLPPHSMDAEKAVLGAILISPDKLLQIEDKLRPHHFFHDAHRKIYNAVLELSAANESADMITVASKLRSMDGDKHFLSSSYLVELMESCPRTQNIQYYLDIVRRDYSRREIIKACQTTIDGAKSFEGTVEEFVETVEKEFLKITNDSDRSGIMLAQPVLESTLDVIQKNIERVGHITGTTSGFRDLDALLGGFQPSDLIILAARPGMGKTAFALNLAVNAANAKKNVVIFTLEMAKEQLMQRILSTEACVDSARLRRGELDEEEQDRLIEGAKRIHKLDHHLGIDETPGVSLTELRSRCRRHHKEFGLDLIVVDYLQLMTSASSKRSDSREREIAEISMGLKGLAKELSVPIIALSQLNRSVESRPDKRPKMSDLRESGSLEQDADIIMFVHRDDYYDKNSENAGVAQIVVAKNRHGEQANIELAYHSNYIAFKDLFRPEDLDS